MKSGDSQPRPVPAGRFKQTCLRLLDQVQETGIPVVITKRGKPVAQLGPVSPEYLHRAWRGAMRGRGRIHGDLIAPASDIDDWQIL